VEVRTRTAKEKGVDELDAFYCPSQHHVAHDLVRHIIESHAMLKSIELRGPYNFHIFFHDSFDASASFASRCTRIILFPKPSGLISPGLRVFASTESSCFVRFACRLAYAKNMKIVNAQMQNNLDVELLCLFGCSLPIDDMNVDCLI